ncbi:YlxR family protein [Deinococcus budaensis]|uniref:YlxR domain-containing protein n=1 Tax=Deinococcus budaensis TaxID=1665626 RepID=A0A7W8LNN1_9DEIO|nr:hypothetical protein [Deinococcus budaensis]
MTVPASLPPTAPSRHVPERSCVACRAKRPQGEFVRVTRVEGGWRVLPGQRTGRGAYVCADSPACWAEKRLRRAFREGAPAISAALHARQAPSVPPITPTPDQP